MNEEEIDKLINDGIGLFKNKKYTEAIEILEKAQGQSTDTKKELEVLLGLGRCYFKKKDFEQASDFFLRLLDLAEQENHIEIKSTSLHWLGRCYFEQKDFNKAIEIFSERLTLAKKENNVKDQLSSLYWLGQCYFGQKDFSKATEIFNKQLILAEQENDVSEQFSSLYWLG